MMVPLLAVGIPVGVSILLYRGIANSSHGKKWRVVAFAPIFVAGVIVFFAFPEADQLAFVFLLTLIAILTIGVPVGASILLYRGLANSSYGKKWRVLALTPIFMAGLIAYIAFNPGEEFYREDFEEATGLLLPDDAKIVFKTASYPDHFGDYTSVSVIHVKEVFYWHLQDHLQKQGMIENQYSPMSVQFEKALDWLDQSIPQKSLSLQKGDRHYYVGFLSDEKTILVSRVSE